MATVLTRIWIVCLSSILAIGRVLSKGFLTLLFSGRKLVVPAIRDPLLLKSAVSLASDIRKGRIKCEDVIKSYVARIREVNPYINAVCEERFEEALDEARKVDLLVASRVKTPQELQNEKPLLGIPFTVKLLIGVKGMYCNAASLLHKDLKAGEDADVVELMKKAGAIVLATTNSPEFGLNFETFNSIYGRTSNPYDTTKTCGGSSGGEGALIGAGGSLIGIGNDIAGSIRHPSNFNCIFGHKPTAGLISNKGMFPTPPPKTNEYVATGPMCRYAEDLVLATRILSGTKAAHMKFGGPVDFSKIKVYYLLESYNPVAPKVTQEIKDTVMKAVDHFKSTYKAEVEEVRIKGMRDALTVYISLQIQATGGKVQDTFSAGKHLNINPTNELLKALFGQSKLSMVSTLSMNSAKFPMVYRAKQHSEMLNRFKQLEEEFNAILDDHSVLFMPSFVSTAHYHHALVPLIAGTVFMCIFNLLGLPVTQCPTGLSEDQLPLGFQVVGAKEQDPLTLAFAMEMEKVFKGWVPPNSHKSSNGDVSSTPEDTVNP